MFLSVVTFRKSSYVRNRINYIVQNNRMNIQEAMDKWLLLDKSCTMGHYNQQLQSYKVMLHNDPNENDYKKIKGMMIKNYRIFQ